MMNGILHLVTAPAVEPLNREEVKLHLHVDSPDEDELLDALVTAARESGEVYTHRRFINSTWDWKFDYGFPDCFEVPFPPLSSVTSISYVDANGDTQTLASSQYTVDAPSGPHAAKGRIVPAYGVSWPTTRDVINAVTVRYVAGYGAAAENVPSLIRTALKVWVADLYTNRESYITGTIVSKLPRTVEALLYPFRMGGIVG